MFDINGYELIVLAVVAIVVLGPERLPEYAAKLGRAVRQLRALAESARSSLKDQLGPEFDEVDWRQYDPRQYDPRRIVREALLEPLDDAVAPIRGEIDSVRDATRIRRGAAGAAGAAGAVAADGADEDLADPLPYDEVGAEIDDAYQPYLVPQEFDPGRPTPYDPDAT